MKNGFFELIFYESILHLCTMKKLVKILNILINVQNIIQKND